MKDRVTTKKRRNKVLQVLHLGCLVVQDQHRPDCFGLNFVKFGVDLQGIPGDSGFFIFHANRQGRNQRKFDQIKPNQGKSNQFFYEKFENEDDPPSLRYGATRAVFAAFRLRQTTVRQASVATGKDDDASNPSESDLVQPSPTFKPAA